MKNLANALLLIPQKADTERGSVAEAWQQLGGTVMKLDRFWEKPILPPNHTISIYGNDTFALIVAQILDLQLVSPNDDLLLQLDRKWTKRNLSLHSLNQISAEWFPVFIKPLVPKQFKAQVYQNQQELQDQTNGLAPDTQVLVSEIITIEAEARGFVLHNQLQDIALYEGNGSLPEAQDFVNDFLTNVSELPATFAIDVAYADSRGWFVLEFNASWGAGLNHCQPQKVIPCVQAATRMHSD